MDKIVNKVLEKMGRLSIATVALSANSTSVWFCHQPEMPKDIAKYKK